MAPPNLIQLTGKVVLLLGLQSDPGIQSDALQDAAIQVGLTKAPFTDLVIDPALSIHPPFNPDTEKDCLLLLLDNLSLPNAFKTLIYTGIVLAKCSDIR